MIISDFEMIIIDCCCHYHFWKSNNSLRMSFLSIHASNLQRNSIGWSCYGLQKKCSISTEFREIFSLAFLPEINVQKKPVKLRFSHSTHQVLQTYPRFDSSFVYVEKIWIEKSGIARWNVDNLPQTLRTSNVYENWHSTWIREIGRVQPSIWTVVFSKD